MGIYVVKYEDWDKKNLKLLATLLNDLMTRLDQSYANDSEEQGWLRSFEGDLGKLINKAGRD